MYRSRRARSYDSSQWSTSPNISTLRSRRDHLRDRRAPASRVNPILRYLIPTPATAVQTLIADTIKALLDYVGNNYKQYPQWPGEPDIDAHDFGIGLMADLARVRVELESGSTPPPADLTCPMSARKRINSAIEGVLAIIERENKLRPYPDVLCTRIVTDYDLREYLTDSVRYEGMKASEAAQDDSDSDTSRDSSSFTITDSLPEDWEAIFNSVRPLGGYAHDEGKGNGRAASFLRRPNLSAFQYAESSADVWKPNWHREALDPEMELGSTVIGDGTARTSFPHLDLLPVANVFEEQQLKHPLSKEHLLPLSTSCLKWLEYEVDRLFTSEPSTIPRAGLPAAMRSIMEISSVLLSRPHSNATFEDHQACYALETLQERWKRDLARWRPHRQAARHSRSYEIERFTPDLPRPVASGLYGRARSFSPGLPSSNMPDYADSHIPGVTVSSPAESASRYWQPRSTSTGRPKQEPTTQHQFDPTQSSIWTQADITAAEDAIKSALDMPTSKTPNPKAASISGVGRMKADSEGAARTKSRALIAPNSYASHTANTHTRRHGSCCESCRIVGCEEAESVRGPESTTTFNSAFYKTASPASSPEFLNVHQGGKRHQKRHVSTQETNRGGSKGETILSATMKARPESGNAATTRANTHNRATTIAAMEDGSDSDEPVRKSMASSLPSMSRPTTCTPWMDIPVQRTQRCSRITPLMKVLEYRNPRLPLGSISLPIS